MFVNVRLGQICFGIIEKTTDWFLKFSRWVCTSGFGDKGNFVVTDGGLGRDGPDRDPDVLQEMLNV